MNSKQYKATDCKTSIANTKRNILKTYCKIFNKQYIFIEASCWRVYGEETSFTNFMKAEIRLVAYIEAVIIS